MKDHTRPGFVYGFFDGDIPIYIGASINPADRERDHRRAAAWWTPELVFRVISEHPNHLSACYVENQLIREHQPVANLLGNPRYGRASEHTKWGWLTGEAAS